MGRGSKTQLQVGENLIFLIYRFKDYSPIFVIAGASAQDEHDENEHDVNDPGIEYPPYDGWYNNRAAPDWGAAETPLLRRLPAAYRSELT